MSLDNSGNEAPGCTWTAHHLSELRMLHSLNGINLEIPVNIPLLTFVVDPLYIN